MYIHNTSSVKWNLYIQCGMKKKRGRPPKNGASAVLPPIRVTPAQKDKYEKAAAKAGMTLSAWIKDLADKASE